jgi:hypothetical protein
MSIRWCEHAIVGRDIRFEGRRRSTGSARPESSPFLAKQKKRMGEHTTRGRLAFCTTFVQKSTLVCSMKRLGGSGL